jgi:DNA-3-methyladenine glycosylase
MSVHLTQDVPAGLLTEVLPAEFYTRDVVDVAQELIGKLLCRRSRAGLCVGMIVETEAYLSRDDSASHSFRGINRRNASMFGAAGRAYVYTIHARQCFNIVTEARGVGSAVLVRAVQPLLGIPQMQQRRRTERLRDLCRGPARLCEAFDIGRSFDGWNLMRGQRLWVAEAATREKLSTRATPRIGVTSAHEAKLRFIVSENPYVSGTAAMNRE